MSKGRLPEKLVENYSLHQSAIKQRLIDFEQVPVSKYFYELCFCVCTPQSRAKNALEVQRILEEGNFYETPFDPTPILREPSRYIRFHNQKAKRLLTVRELYPEIEKVILSDISPYDKREFLVERLNGFGMKEASHYLRNIGFKNLAILDRHILRWLVECGVFEEVPNIATKKRYLEVESEFQNLAKQVNIPLDELDLLFWVSSTGEIIK